MDFTVMVSFNTKKILFFEKNYGGEVWPTDLRLLSNKLLALLLAVPITFRLKLKVLTVLTVFENYYAFNLRTQNMLQ